MKKAIWISIGLLVLIGCKKNEDNTFVPGKIITNVNYKGNSVKSKMKSGNLKATDSASQLDLEIIL